MIGKMLFLALAAKPLLGDLGALLFGLEGVGEENCNSILTFDGCVKWPNEMTLLICRCCCYQRTMASTWWGWRISYKNTTCWNPTLWCTVSKSPTSTTRRPSIWTPMDPMVQVRESVGEKKISVCIRPLFSLFSFLWRIFFPFDFLEERFYLFWNTLITELVTWVEQIYVHRYFIQTMFNRVYGMLTW